MKRLVITRLRLIISIIANTIANTKNNDLLNIY